MFIDGIGFEVTYRDTDRKANLDELRREEWTRKLFDLRCFALTQPGELIILDENGHWEYCSPERFDIKLEFTITKL